MQSGGNSYCGDVVLESFNMAYSDVDQKYEKHEYFELFNYEDCKFKSVWRKCIFKEMQHISTANS